MYTKTRAEATRRTSAAAAAPPLGFPPPPGATRLPPLTAPPFRRLVMYRGRRDKKHRDRVTLGGKWVPLGEWIDRVRWIDRFMLDSRVKIYEPGPGPIAEDAVTLQIGNQLLVG